MGEAAFERARPTDYLTRLATSELGSAYKSLAVSALGIEPGVTVVDLGCGPGADLLAFAAAVGRDGVVIGLDHDLAAVREAREQTAASSAVSVRHADIQATGLATCSVDRVHTDRVLQHVADPLAVLRETSRVLRPAGRAVFAEPDWDTLVVDYPILEVPRAYRRFIVDQVVRNACIGRQLPRLAEQAGMTVTRVVPVTATFRDPVAADRILGFHRVTERAVSAGYLDRAAAGDWLEYLATGPFFASTTMYLIVADAVAQPGSVTA